MARSCLDKARKTVELSQDLTLHTLQIEMSGINVLEIKNNKTELQKLWLRGGFTESCLAKNNNSVGKDVTLISLARFMKKLQLFEN